MSRRTDIYDTEAGVLSITDETMGCEFQFATHQAIVNMVTEFEFYGYVIETAVAIDVVRAITEQRTYH